MKIDGWVGPGKVEMNFSGPTKVSPLLPAREELLFYQELREAYYSHNHHLLGITLAKL